MSACWMTSQMKALCARATDLENYGVMRKPRDRLDDKRR
jgi:hypothetical protein